MADWSRVARRIRVPLGFAFALFYFWLAHPSWKSIALGAVLIVPGLLVRALASGHVRKNEALATSGPYAYTRNPLYLGSTLVYLGLSVAAGSLWAIILLVPLLWVINVGVVAREERYLERKFGNAYRTYKARVRRWV